jgi:hypothetical protein
VFQDLKGSVAPDLIIVPRRDDAHQDHRLVAELTWNTFRDHLVLEYEIPKYDGDLGNPNLFGRCRPRSASGRRSCCWSSSSVSTTAVGSPQIPCGHCCAYAA